MVSVYVDDNFCMGHKQALIKLVDDIKNMNY